MAIPRLLERYRKEVVPALEKEFNYGSADGKSRTSRRSC